MTHEEIEKVVAAVVAIQNEQELAKRVEEHTVSIKEIDNVDKRVADLRKEIQSDLKLCREFIYSLPFKNRFGAVFRVGLLIVFAIGAAGVYFGISGHSTYTKAKEFVDEQDEKIKKAMEEVKTKNQALTKSWEERIEATAKKTAEKIEKTEDAFNARLTDALNSSTVNDKQIVAIQDALESRFRVISHAAVMHQFSNTHLMLEKALRSPEAMEFSSIDPADLYDVSCIFFGNYQSYIKASESGLIGSNYTKQTSKEYLAINRFLLAIESLAKGDIAGARESLRICNEIDSEMFEPRLVYLTLSVARQYKVYRPSEHAALKESQVKTIDEISKYLEKMREWGRWKVDYSVAELLLGLFHARGKPAKEAKDIYLEKLERVKPYINTELFRLDPRLTYYLGQIEWKLATYEYELNDISSGDARRKTAINYMLESYLSDQRNVKALNNFLWYATHKPDKADTPHLIEEISFPSKVVVSSMEDKGVQAVIRQGIQQLSGTLYVKHNELRLNTISEAYLILGNYDAALEFATRAREEAEFHNERKNLKMMLNAETNIRELKENPAKRTEFERGLFKLIR